MLVTYFLVVLFTFTYGYWPVTTPVTCMWHKRECVEQCPENLEEVVGDCKTGYWPAQKTCEYPEERLVSYKCGYGRCDCPDPLVLDEDTGVCYDVDGCPTRHELVFKVPLK